MTGACLSYTIYSIAVDDLTTQGAGSESMVLTCISMNIHGQLQKGLLIQFFTVSAKCFFSYR